MKTPAVRIFFYIFGGSLVLAWMAPGEGIAQVLLILALIVVSAYLDAFLFGRLRRNQGGEKVVSLGKFKAQRNQRNSTGGSTRGRKAPQQVFSSPLPGEAEGLAQILRAEGMRPLMVTQASGDGNPNTLYKVLVPESELKKAQPLIDLFRARESNHPS